MRLTVRTRVLDFMQERLSSDTQDEVFTSSWIKKLEVLVGDAEMSRATQMSRVEKLELSTVGSCRSNSFGEVL